MLHRSEFLFVIEREEMIRNVFSDWESVMSLVFDFPIDRTEFKDVFVRFRNGIIFELV